MTTLVTGAPGWLGTALTRELKRRGHRLRCLVQDGVDPAPLLPGPEVDICRGDVRHAASLGRAMEGVDTVFHCAGVIHPSRIADLFEVNTRGTGHALQAAIDHGVTKFVYVSSASAQGTTPRPELMDESQPCRPENAYGRSKLEAELLVNEYHRIHALPTVIIRPPMLYGPCQPVRMTRLMRMVKTGRPPVFGDGRNLRSIANVANVVSAMLLAESCPLAAGQTYWIADEKPHTTLEILQTIADILGVGLRPLHLPAIIARAGETAARVLSSAGVYSLEAHVVGESIKNVACSVEKARRELGYRPQVSLPDGMRAAVEWCWQQGHLAR